MKKTFFSPFGLVLILLLVNNFIQGDFSNPGHWIYNKMIILPGIIIGLSFHEFAHAAASHLLGDPTPKYQGRLTVNPLAHIDPFGFIALMFCGFGWGVPVQIDPRYYKHRRRDEFLVSIAGVMMNLLIAVLSGFILRGILHFVPEFYNSFIGNIIFEMIIYVIMINLVLMAFNLIPVPPLDGFGIITQIFNLRKYDWYYQIYDKGFLILLLLILFDITDLFLSPIVDNAFELIINYIVY